MFLKIGVESAVSKIEKHLFQSVNFMHQTLVTTPRKRQGIVSPYTIAIHGHTASSFPALFEWETSAFVAVFIRIHPIKWRSLFKLTKHFD